MWKNFKVIDADAQCMSRSIFGNATSSLNIETKFRRLRSMVYEPNGKFVLGARIRNRRGVGKMTARSKQREFNNL